MDNTIVKLYGLNHSGSHYLAWLLNENFSNMVVLHSHTGWNHGHRVFEFEWDATKWNTDPYFDGNISEHATVLKSELLNSGKPVTHYQDDIRRLYESKELPMFILVRNPYTWLYSYCVKHYKDGEGRTLQRGMRLWSDINRDYRDMPWPKEHYIKYEKLRDNTEGELERISKFLDKPFKNDTIIDTEQNVIELFHGNNTNQKFKKTNETDYTNIINTICKHESISHEQFSMMFNELIQKDVLDWYNKL
jgi:hypothetical protein